MLSRKITNILAVSSCMACSCIICYPGATVFASPTLLLRIELSLMYLLVAAILLIMVQTLLKVKYSVQHALVLGLMMIIAASVLYSIVRQYPILLFLPSLFALPGCALGAMLARLMV